MEEDYFPKMHTDAMKLAGRNAEDITAALADAGPDLRGKFMNYFRYVGNCLDGRKKYQEMCAFGCEDPGHTFQITRLQTWRAALTPLFNTIVSKSVAENLARKQEAASAAAAAQVPVGSIQSGPLPAALVQAQKKSFAEAKAERKVQAELKAREAAAAKQAQQQKAARAVKEFEKKNSEEESKLLDRMAALALNEKKDKVNAELNDILNSKLFKFLNALPGIAELGEDETVLQGGPLSTFIPRGHAVLSLDGVQPFGKGYYILVTNDPDKLGIKLYLSPYPDTDPRFSAENAYAVKYDMKWDVIGSVFAHQYFSIHPLSEKERKIIDHPPEKKALDEETSIISAQNNAYVCAVMEYVRENKFHAPRCSESAKNVRVNTYLKKLRKASTSPLVLSLLRIWVDSRLPMMTRYIKDIKLAEELVLFYMIKNLYVDIIYGEGILGRTWAPSRS